MEFIKLQLAKAVVVSSVIIFIGLLNGCIESLSISLVSLLLFIITIALTLVFGRYVAIKEGFTYEEC